MAFNTSILSILGNLCRKYSYMNLFTIIGMTTYPDTMCHKGIDVVLSLVIIIKTTPRREIPTCIHININVTCLHSTQFKKKHEGSNSN